MDMICRSHTDMNLVRFLQMGAALMNCKIDLGQDWKQLFSTSQHLKAYTSAMVSWIKAYIIRLCSVAAAVATPAAGKMAHPIEEEHDIALMVMCLHDIVHNLRPTEVDMGSANTSRLGRETLSLGNVAEWSYSGIKISLLVWTARAVAEMAQQLLLCCQQFTAAADSTKSDNVGHRRGNSSTSSSTGASESGSSDKAICAEIVLCNRYDKNGTGAAVQQSPILYLDIACEVVLFLVERLLEWHSAALADHEPAASAHSQQAGGSPSCHPDESALPRSTPPTTAAAAAAVSVPRSAGAAAQQQPSRLNFKPPHKGLPFAVVKDLERLKGRFPSDNNEGRQVVEDRQLQLMVRLQDGMELCKLLQREVPVPVGCNNPVCLNLQGVAEMKTACKICLGCHVARYCSRECQAGHWKDHKKACQQLQ
jgi:hypothetical protein